MISDRELLELEKLVHEQEVYEAKSDLLKFTKKTFEKFNPEKFHETYYNILNLFAQKRLKNIIISMPPQHGKALCVETPVLTTRGWKKHGELKAGDYVFGENGKPVKVLGTTEKYLCQSSKVKFSTGDEIIASNVHEWKILCDREKYRGRKRVAEILETKDILTNQRRSPAIVSDIVLKTRKKKLDIDPYVLGVWLGDGAARMGKITIGKEDIDHFSFLGKPKEVKKGIYEITIDGLTKKLRLNNLLQNKHIPEKYFLSSEKDRLNLLRGLMDTDGTIDKKGRCEFTQKHSRLSKDVKILLRTLGIKHSLKTYDMKLNGVKVGLKDRIFFVTDNKRVFNLKRKYERQKFQCRADANKFFINEVLKIGEKLVNCIEVEGGLYLCGESLILTHNSECSSRRLPAFITGLRPDEKQALICYNASKAQKFGREIMGIIREPIYNQIFPHVEYPDRGYTGAKSNTNMERESINSRGSMKFVGVNGALTGDPVDVLIMDDLYKDWQEANSPIIRQRVWDWYTSVAETRLHNDSQQLIVFTRWSEDDLVGRLQKLNKVVDLDLNKPVEEQIDNLEHDQFLKINFPAIQNKEPSLLDPRQKGEALWESRHSIKKLLSAKSKNEGQFQCLYQGDPQDKKGLLYGDDFMTYKQLPDIAIKKAYVDTADKGTDFLCGISYALPTGSSDLIYIIDVVYTQEPMEVTERMVIDMLNRNDIHEAKIESNNGGRGFARVVEREVNTDIITFTQSNNKESRILSNSSKVKRLVVFPEDWQIRWSEFSEHLTKYKKVFSANEHDDCADCLTGVVETEDLSTQNVIIW